MSNLLPSDDSISSLRTLFFCASIIPCSSFSRFCLSASARLPSLANESSSVMTLELASCHFVSVSIIASISAGSTSLPITSATSTFRAAWSSFACSRLLVIASMTVSSSTRTSLMSSDSAKSSYVKFRDLLAFDTMVSCLSLSSCAGVSSGSVSLFSL
eukprot:TRINITY_DN10860_c0_g1_i2.p1 TRINITY_DN10860_c0_g1~~TRINITY_DN10860_c0_g1_i2.p1  ORF type:complete len:158 (-),score=7.02 TRINITY_DN10860_c0_g1_i2:135-608(-)